MSITYGAGPGTIVTEFAADETLPNQSQQTGNNTVVMSNPISTAPPGNGQIGTKFPTYVGRLVIINIAGASPQVRMVASQANGTGTTRILTVSEDWDTNPVETDTIHVFYDIDDLETGGAGGGIALNAKSGLYELTNNLTVGDGSLRSGLQINSGVGLEADDTGSTLQNCVKSAGYLYAGYKRAAGRPIAGSVLTFVNNVAGEPTWQFQSGSKGLIADSLMWGQLASLFMECAAGSTIEFNGTKLLSASYGSTLFGATLTNASISGRGSASELVRLNANTVVNGLVLLNTGGLTTALANVSTETLTVRDAVFVANVALLTINSNKTWKMINPVWLATTYSDFSFIDGVANYVYDQRSIDAIVQQADGTVIGSANVIVYENTILADLVLKTYSNGSGVATGAFTYKLHSTNSSTVTYGGHALRCDGWMYSPYVATQASTAKFSGVIVLSPDQNIVQMNQATARSVGDGVISWNKDGNASSVIAYTDGTGTLAVGTTVTGGSSGATGVVTQIVNGNSTNGKVHLKSRNATAFSGTEGLSASGWSGAVLTASSEQRFSIWIDAATKTMQQTHDYLAAVTADTTMTAPAEVMHEWGRDSQARALYLGSAGFYTERSYTQGVFITNCGAGLIEGFTDDAGTMWTPPTSVTLTVIVKTESGSVIENALAYIDDNDVTPFIMNTLTDSFGEASVSHTAGAVSGSRWRVRKYGYKPWKQLVDIGAADITLPVTLIVDPQQT